MHSQENTSMSRPRGTFVSTMTAVGVLLGSFASAANAQIEASSESPARRAEKIATSIGPTYYIDYDYENKAVNLTPHDGPTSGTPSLQVDRYGAGFKVTRFRSLEVGFGGEIIFHYDNVESGLKDILYGSVGLMPQVGTTTISEYFVRDRQELKTKKAPRLPNFADDLADWSVGDRVSYENSGGLVFSAGIGLGHWVGVGATATAGGKWKTQVEKRDEFTAVVQITDTDVQSLGVYVGNVFTKIGVSKFKNEAEAFSYAFDLRSIRARMAFEDFMKGNILAIQKMVERGDLPDVWRVAKSTSIEVGTTKFFTFGIPILWNFAWGSSRILTFTAEENFENEYKIDADYGVYYKERKSRGLFTHRNTVEAFYGSIYHYSDKETPSFDGHYGEYYFTYAGSDSTHYRLRMAVKEIIRQTGLKNELLVNVPELDDIKYAGVEFRMMIPQEATDALIARGSRYSQSSFVKEGMQFYTDYFREAKAGRSNWDPNDLCANHGWDLDRCLSEMNYQTRSSLKKMHAALAEMRSVLGKDRKAFARAYGDFGKAMAKNQFTFQMGMKTVGAGLKFTYRIEGERLSRFEKVFASSGTGIRLVRSTGPLALKRVSGY